MFNTQLPSGRRKLFVLILVLFLVVGFGTKYLLIQWGWIESTAASPSPKTNEKPLPVKVDPQESAPVFTEEEIHKAQQNAETFVRTYATYNPKQMDTWLRKLQPVTAGSLFATLKEEKEMARPTNEVQAANLQKVEKISCQAQNTSIECLIAAVVEEKDGKGNKTLIEKIYDLEVVKEEINWVVKEVNIRGSFD